MNKIFILSLWLLGTSFAFSQGSLLKFNEYKSTYIPIPQDILEARAKAAAMKEAEQLASFNYYKDLAINSGIKNNYSHCVYYAKMANKFGYTQNTLLYYEGKSYIMLGKVSKYKKVLRKANKYHYYDVVSSLKSLKKP